MPKLVLPADAPSLADAVAQAVRDGVATGELAPGTTYSVYQLADLLGVSRSPAREGLLRLAEAGLVEIRRNRGFRVLPPQAQDIEEIIGIRLALEPPAARQAAVHGAAEQHAAIRAALDAMAAAVASGDEASFWAADRSLHDLLLHAAGKPRTAGIVERLRGTTALLGPPTTASGRTLREIHAEHQPVVAAVLARDGEAAEGAMRAHLEATRDLLVANLRRPVG
ncbi:putative GntR-family transcriptional regulator [Actinoplanes missouriensis 431]|uniref:Putative GntR-family transcriptional regulator n=1 Tax=Actinoplanes missouriensis (strain ATCC 14538 / DSM 43046 / CBS 188.64 / JCM 3121 / NBRC 102363 / NCIMB 12654 / NRRL B-3342 / UNCC 431) TaxID=512565 RepID=I0H885_ACTM4|nr:GntR family transcriptional regulator [Actinoplanes missouriensis]BAL89222.1 putative GntR-family transcriptional regulator [Actinoplanes missouriensis 431]